MKRGFAVLATATAIALLASPAAAQTSYLRGPDGRGAGRVEHGSDGSTRFYDARGRNAGRAEPGSDGTVRLHDNTGRNAGEIVQRPAPGAAWRPSAPTHRGTDRKASD